MTPMENRDPHFAPKNKVSIAEGQGLLRPPCCRQAAEGRSSPWLGAHPGPERLSRKITSIFSLFGVDKQFR